MVCDVIHRMLCFGTNQSIFWRSSAMWDGKIISKQFQVKIDHNVSEIIKYCLVKVLFERVSKVRKLVFSGIWWFFKKWAFWTNCKTLKNHQIWHQNIWLKVAKTLIQGLNLFSIHTYLANCVTLSVTCQKNHILMIDAVGIPISCFFQSSFTQTETKIKYILGKI